MTRDELIEQAARIASGRRSGKRGLVHWQRIVARLVDADWRPVIADDDTHDRLAQAIHAADHDDVYVEGDAIGRAGKPALENDWDRYSDMAEAVLAALRGSDV